MSVLRLLGELVRRERMVERELPATGEPLEHRQLPERHRPSALVPPGSGGGLKLVENAARPVELSEIHQLSRQRATWAVEVVEWEPEALLDRHAALEQARCDLARVHLARSQPRDRGCEPGFVSGALDLLERRAGRVERRPHVDPPRWNTAR